VTARGYPTPTSTRVGRSPAREAGEELAGGGAGAAAEVHALEDLHPQPYGGSESRW
jgi:hypothetical protein